MEIEKDRVRARGGRDRTFVVPGMRAVLRVEP
jgi:hypothetical protein